MKKKIHIYDKLCTKTLNRNNLKTFKIPKYLRKNTYSWHDTFTCYSLHIIYDPPSIKKFQLPPITISTTTTPKKKVTSQRQINIPSDPFVKMGFKCKIHTMIMNNNNTNISRYSS